VDDFYYLFLKNAYFYTISELRRITMRIENKMTEPIGLELIVETRINYKSTIRTYTIEELLEAINAFSQDEVSCCTYYTPEDVEIVLLQPNRKKKS